MEKEFTREQVSNILANITYHVFRMQLGLNNQTAAHYVLSKVLEELDASRRIVDLHSN